MRIVRTVAVAGLALVAIAAVAAWTCPADLAWRWFGPGPLPLTLRGLGGTVWAGHADAAELFGQDLGSLDWTLHKTPLLHGEAIADFVLHGAEFGARGTLSRTSGGGLEFRDCVLTLPARLAAPVLAIPALQPLGIIEVDIARARLVGAWLGDVEGTAHWREAAVAGAAQAQIGELRAVFASTADGAIAGTLSDAGGPLEVSGSFQATLGRYAAQARLAPRGENPRLAEALQYVGQPQADGSRELLIEGRQLQLF